MMEEKAPSRIFCAPSRIFLPPFGKHCPGRVQIAQTVIRFAHIQVQAQMDTHHAVMVLMPEVKFLNTSIFH